MVENKFKRNRTDEIMRIKFLENTNKTSDIITLNAMNLLESIYGEYKLHLLGPYKDYLYSIVKEDDMNTPLEVIGVFTGSEQTYFGITKQHSPIEKEILMNNRYVKYKLYEIKDFYKTISIAKNIHEIAFLYATPNMMYSIDKVGFDILKIKDQLQNKYLQFKYELKQQAIDNIKHFKNTTVDSEKYLYATEAFVKSYLLIMLEDSDSIFYPILDNDTIMEIKYKELELEILYQGVQYIEETLNNITMLDEEVKFDTMYQKIEELCITTMKDIITEMFQKE